MKRTSIALPRLSVDHYGEPKPGVLHGEGIVAATVGGRVEHGACNHVQHFGEDSVRLFVIYETKKLQTNRKLNLWNKNFEKNKNNFSS